MSNVAVIGSQWGDEGKGKRENCGLAVFALRITPLQATLGSKDAAADNPHIIHARYPA